jgi:aspartate racemase
MIAERTKKEIFGIVGGMGPLASAEFLKTIYEQGIGEPEQDSPIVLMYSDPTFPDRTEAFIEGSSHGLVEQLSRALATLCDQGASRIIICCITIHYLLPQLPPYLRGKVVSLLDVIFAHLEHSRTKHLLLCSSGTSRMRLFQEHSQWGRLQDYIVVPDAHDQDLIHREIIYPIKRNYEPRKLIPLLESLLEKYNVDSFVAGCSEIHLLAKHYASTPSHKQHYGCLDPLSLIAAELAKECR